MIRKRAWPVEAPSHSPEVRSLLLFTIRPLPTGGFMKALALVALVSVVLFVPAVKAETIGPATTWDYTFSTDSATCAATGLSCIATSGSVVFTLELVSVDGTETSRPCMTSWEQVIGMTGTINGAAISFTPQDVSSCGNDRLFTPSDQQGLMRPAIDSSILFTANGLNWSIFGPDHSPYNNSVLINNSAGQTAVLNWNLIDPPPVVTAEAGTMEMMLIGLVGLTLATYRKAQK